MDSLSCVQVVFIATIYKVNLSRIVVQHVICALRHVVFYLVSFGLLAVNVNLMRFPSKQLVFQRFQLLASKSVSYPHYFRSTYGVLMEL
jgi:hypothetical protein